MGWRLDLGVAPTNARRRKRIMNLVSKIDELVEVRRVLVSVSDKRYLDRLIPGLIRVNPGIGVFSTGGTFAAIRDILGEGAGKNLVQVSEYTGQPEMQGGLVKTLDFKIYLGLLSETYNQDHIQDLRRTGAVPIDMVVVNLYPFKQTVAQKDATPERARANIDIGGPCMIRAAAKNFHRVAAVTDPGDYEGVLQEIESNGGCCTLRTRYELAQKAFGHTADYDTAIASYLESCRFDLVQNSYTILA
jgi:phosphoribosylaminoimidazolecarboxamide formyltransferase/IMP cyclohydrolase